MITEIEGLERLGNVVPEGYRYYQKRAEPSLDLNLSHAYLKWYDIYPLDAEITPDQRNECRNFVADEAAHIPLKDDLGFVILHRAGTVLLLLITTWRNTNELWEAVYWKAVDGTEPYQPMPCFSEHRGTYCVWELPVVWHERHAWVRFLSSPDDNAAKLAYINDRFSGMV